MCIFLDSGDYRQFVYQLGDVVEKFRVECWGYCVMPNHYHAIFRPTLPNISLAMAELNGEYAKWWNRRHQRVGHTFQGRFKDQIVQSENYLLTLCRYVARNPVRAGLVDDPATWPWSSYPATISTKPTPPFLTLAPVLAQFGDDSVATLRARFSAYVLGDPQEEALEDRIRSDERVLGDRAFKDAIRRDASACSATSGGVREEPEGGNAAGPPGSRIRVAAVGSGV